MPKMNARNEKCSPPGTYVHMVSKMSRKDRKEGVGDDSGWFIITAFAITRRVAPLDDGLFQTNRPFHTIQPTPTHVSRT